MIRLLFLCKESDPFCGRILKASLNNKETIIASFKTKGEIRETDDVIDHYQLIRLEDGIYNIVAEYDKRTYLVSADLHKHTLHLTDTGNIVKDISGSVCFIKENDETDHKPFTNQEIAADFWMRFFDQHDESAIDDYLAEPYIQHNPTVPDGVEAFRNEFHDRFSSDMKECHTQIMHISSKDDLVFIHNILKRSPLVRGHAAVDIFRLKNGKIIEHWDVIQKMPESSVNDHPMF